MESGPLKLIDEGPILLHIYQQSQDIYDYINSYCALFLDKESNFVMHSYISVDT